MQALATKLDGISSLRPPLVTSLPGSPADGQEVYYVADAANGIVWFLRYRAAATGTYKWEFLGGPPLYAELNTQETFTVGSQWTDTATPGPQLTLPLAGDWMTTGGASFSPAPTSGFWNVGAAPKFGAAAVSGVPLTAFGANGTMNVAGSRVRRDTGIAAGTVVKLQGNVTITGPVTWANRWLAITPIRVG